MRLKYSNRGNDYSFFGAGQKTGIKDDKDIKNSPNP